MLDPFSFNQLGKIRQQEILEQAERDRDAMTFGEMAAVVKRLFVSGWQKAQRLTASLRVDPQGCDEPASSPSVPTETC